MNIADMPKVCPYHLTMVLQHPRNLARNFYLKYIRHTPAAGGAEPGGPKWQNSP